MELVDASGPIEELKARLQARLAEIEEQLRPLQGEATKLRTQLDLVTKLLRVTKADSTILESPQQVLAPGVTISGKTLADGVAEVLLSAGTPLHISEIRTKYLDSGRMIPGKGTYANLLAYMVRDRRFVRTAKGTYALSGRIELSAEPIKRRKRRRRR